MEGATEYEAIGKWGARQSSAAYYRLIRPRADIQQ